jgi:DNA-binding CsgD family transcriptional regulator
MQVTAPHISPLDRLHEDFRWTARQRQVLDLLAARRTNGEIADDLGISLDGAKWHVSEVMTKLGTNSRDEAAEYWRAYNRMPLRFSRIMRGMVPGLAIRKVAIGVGVLAVIGATVLGVLLVASLGDDDSKPAASDGTPSATLATGSPGATQTPEPDPSASPSPTATIGPLEVLGLFEEPRERVPDVVEERTEAPASGFDPDAGPAVIYDTATGETIDLGDGHMGRFSPDGARYTWVASDELLFGGDAGEIRVINLSTGEIETIGAGGSPVWLDDRQIAFWTDNPDTHSVMGLDTGVLAPVSQDEYKAAFERPFEMLETMSDGLRISADGDYKVVDTATEEVVLEFEGFYAIPAGEGTIVVATNPVDGVSNIFLVTIETRFVRFIGSTRISEFNFPLVANDEIVAWVDNYCGSPQGNLSVYFRRSDRLVEVDNGDNRWGYLHATPRALLGIGDFGAYVMLELATLSLVHALRGAEEAWEHGYGGDTVWSPDYRYAARGFVGGHGGLCP